MISTEGKVKVMDFGIARAATSNTIHSDVMGSVHYSSPEQARNGFIDGKSDIYSLGIVMYEMVTGRVPFDGDTTVSIAIQHLQEEMVPPSAYAPDLPISLEKIILKCTQKSPSRRYQNIGDLIQDLKKALVHPNEDFVTVVPLMNQDKTRVISEQELNQIKRKQEDEYADNYDDTYEDEYDDDGYDDDGYDEYDGDEDGEYEDDYEDEDYEDENAGNGLNPKMEKAITIMGIVVAIIIVFIIIYLVGSFFGLFKFGSSKKADTQAETQTQTQVQTESDSESEEDDADKVTMIDVRGMTYDDAKDALNKVGLGIFKNGTQSSDDYAEGEIVSQDVEKGEKVDKNTTVKVVISSGKGSVPVPDVSGKSSDDATSKLEAEGFKVSTDYKYSDTVAQGKVVETAPSAGTSAQKGETVTIYLSRGPEGTEMPNLIGQTEEQAKSTLNSMGCSVNVNTEYNTTQEAGKVVGQSIDPGVRVTSGTTVTIAISKGEPSYGYKATITAPSASGDTYVVSADITLTDSNGNTLFSQSVDISSFPYTLEKTGITGSDSGTLKITWNLNNGTQSDQTQSVSFTQIN